MKGVSVFDRLGADHGLSRVAGATAVGQTIATRTLYLAPPMLIPPLLFGFLRRRGHTAAWPPVVANLAFAACVGCCSAFATPLCIALFDQRASLPAHVMEPRFHGRTDAQGALVTRYCFNKGL